MVLRFGNHPDPFQGGLLSMKAVKQLATSVVVHEARRAFHTDDTDGIHTHRGDLQGLFRIGKTTDLDRRQGSVFAQGLNGPFFLGSLLNRRCGDTDRMLAWEKAGNC